MDSGYYERYMLSKEKVLPEPIQKLNENPFLDSYLMKLRKQNCKLQQTNTKKRGD